MPPLIPNKNPPNLPNLAIILLTALLSLSCVNKQQDRLPDDLRGKVIGIIDGDTIDILYDGKPLRIRLAHIDCPEVRKKQPFGRTARQFTSDHCFGQTVSIRHHHEFDRNKRLIGEVITQQGSNLNMELVKAGLAWHFKKYSDDKEYAVMESRARASRMGLWGEPNPTPPWDWRAPKKS